MSGLAAANTPGATRAVSESPPGCPVVRIITRLNVGGPALHVLHLTRDLDPQRFSTTLIAGAPGDGEGDLTPEVRAAGVEPLILGALRRRISWLSDLWAFVRVVHLLLRIRPLIVHTHTAKAGALGRLAAWLCGVPIRVHTFHGHVFHGYFSPRKSRAVVVTERWLARLTDCIVVLSARQQDEICEGYAVTPRARTRIIPLGLELARFARAKRGQGQFREELGIAAGAPLIGIVGRLAPVKDHHLFLEIAAALAARWRDRPLAPRFVIIGDGELRDELEQRRAALGLEEQVAFCGWRRDLERIYADLDVTVLTSLNEGLPVSLIEAMAAGAPVAAAAVGGVGDLLGEGNAPADNAHPEAGWRAAARGILVYSRQPQAWCGAIEAALAPGTAATERCERARRHVLEHYAAKRLVADIEALYLELLDRKGLMAQPPASSTTSVAKPPTGRAAPPWNSP